MPWQNINRLLDATIVALSAWCLLLACLLASCKSSSSIHAQSLTTTQAAQYHVVSDTLAMRIYVYDYDTQLAASCTLAAPSCFTAVESPSRWLPTRRFDLLATRSATTLDSLTTTTHHDTTATTAHQPAGLSKRRGSSSVVVSLVCWIVLALSVLIAVSQRHADNM